MGLPNVVAAKVRESACCIIVNRLTNGLCRRHKYDYRMMFVKRSSKMKFMPNAVAFPGGSVDEVDRLNGKGSDVRMLDCLRADDHHYDKAYRRAAVRELQEETGLMLGENTQLIPWSMWKTPLHLKMRFNTVFYMVFLQSDVCQMNLKKEDSEVQSIDWFSPAEILHEAKDGKIEIAPPQFLDVIRIGSHKNFEALSEFCVQRSTLYNTTQYMSVVCKFLDARAAIFPEDSFYEDALEQQLQNVSHPLDVPELCEDNCSKQSSLNRFWRREKPDKTFVFKASTYWDGHVIEPFDDVIDIINI